MGRRQLVQRNRQSSRPGARSDRCGDDSRRPHTRDLAVADRSPGRTQSPRLSRDPWEKVTRSAG